MDASAKKYVKVRINAAGKRIIGILAIPPPYSRVSDFLNSHDDFLLIKQEHDAFAIAKDAISYLEALSEGKDTGSRPTTGTFHSVTAALKDRTGTLDGEMFVPEGADLMSTLGKIRRFINLRNVNFVDSPEHYDFLAIGKQELIFIREATPKS